MSASSTSSSTSCSQEEGEPGAGKRSADEADSSTLKKRMQQYGSIVGYANSSMSTLDRSQYHSLPLNGTRRVTVQFGRMKIVVPWKESDSTVGQLAEAALLRYKKARGMTNDDERVRVLRLECASDGGILDMDDVLEEVFDLNYDQILAITDEANGDSSTPTYTPIQKHPNNHHQQHHYAQPLPYSRKPDGPATPIASAFGSVSVNHQAHRSASPYNVGYTAHNLSRDAPPPVPPKDRRNSVVEVNSFDAVPQSGLRVSTSTPRTEPILRSSLRTEASGSRVVEEATPTKQPRVTLSPEVEKKLAEQEGGDERKSERRRHYEKNPGRFNRGSDRKSRINEALLDARDRIVEQIEADSEKTPKRTTTTRGKLEKGHEEGTTIVTFPVLDESEPAEARQMGIEVIAVLEDESIPSTSHQSSKLIAVEVTKIEEGGRIARDGRIRVGDCIREINGRPVNQMSMIRARAYIADLAEANRDVTLLINRPVESFTEQESAAVDAKPIQSALQQANTQYIGHTTIVELIKSSNGFGFTVTGRETSKGERLFYIGTVKPYGVALGHLKSGDRLLEINGESTGQWTQAEIVEKLKETMVGAKIRFLVSRVSQQQPTSSGNTSTSSQNKENENVGAQSIFEAPPDVQKLPLPALLTPPVRAPKESPVSPSSSAPSRFDLVIPVNGSGSAGLGVSLKARVSKKSDGSKKDCGIFIKNVMHGGAAFKEGHLRVDDRIVGVEDVDLESMSNTDASHALARKLKEIGPTSPNVKLTIVRSDEDHHAGPISRDSSRITVDAPSPAPSSRMSSQTAPSSIFLQSPQTRATSSSGVESSQHSRQSSSASSSGPAIIPSKPSMNERDSIVSDVTRLDESEMPETDPFDREAPGRKSLSEKRGMGAASDPQHIKLFQEIKHQRQNSAPTSSTQKRSKSQPRSLSQRNYRSPMKLIDLPQGPASATMPRHQQQQQQDETDMMNRRSQSMESINRPVESILRGTGTGQKVQFMQTSDQQHPFPPGSTALMRLKSEESRSRDKSRRKSVGNAFSVMRNFFKFGSKSREASPEKTPTRPPILEESRSKTIVPQQVPPPPPPHLQAIRRGSAGGIYVDYGEPYGIIPQYPHNTTSGYESYADSELYDRYAAHRYQRGEDDYLYRQPSSSSLNPPTYVNYGLPAAYAFHVDARVPPPTSSSAGVGGSVTAASMRRAGPHEYDDETSYQHITPAARYRQGGSSGGRNDYHHMFNSWFAYSGGGAAGAAPLLKSAYGSGSPVRIVAATTLRDERDAAATPPPSASASAAAGGSHRGRSTSSGAIPSGSSGVHGSAKEKYADARSGRQQQQSGGGSTRLFIPRHGGGLAAASFATNFGGPAPHHGVSGSYDEAARGSTGSPSQYRRQPHRFPQY